MDSEPRDELTTFETAGGVRVTRTAGPFDPALLAGLSQAVDERRGGVLSSGMEYPGRYSRWHIAYVDPCVEIVARGRRIARPGAERPRPGAAARRRARPCGRAGEPARGGPPTGAADNVDVVIRNRTAVHRGGAQPPPDRVHRDARDHRGVRPCDDPHLGLYGAFGYDLAFQFEPSG